MSARNGRVTRLRPRFDVGEELMALPTRSPTWRSGCS